MKVILPNKRKRNIIIMIVFAVILAASGIFLLWRVNQQEQLSPEDSDAVACFAGEQCPACEWPNVSYCGCSASGNRPADTSPLPRTCGCRNPNNFSCGPACGTATKCSPPGCPTGWTSCGTSGQSGAKASGCVAKTSCGGACTICKNKFVVKRYCKKLPENKCDSGEWEIKPSTTYEYCDEVKYSFVAKDSDGIDSASISVKLNDSARASFSQTEQATQTAVSETLSTATSCLPAGSYTILASWKDKKGAGGDTCTLTTSFEVLEEVLNPDWSISKQAVERCVDEDTDNPKAEISYTITVSNTGEGIGSLDKVVDTPDTKVLESSISNISTPGAHSEGTIVWDLVGEDEEFTAGQSKTFTYTITVQKENFGEYTNTATAYPKESDAIKASAQITADCEITEPEIPEEPLPETGIFDETESSLVVGAILLFLGFAWTWIGQRIFLFVKFMGSAKSWIVERKQDLGSRIQNRKKQHEITKSKQRKEKFEKKVVNKR